MTIPDLPLPMILCHRDELGRIDALSRQPMSAEETHSGGWQAVATTDAEVDAFLSESSTRADALSQSDTAMARVLEDLIDTLIDRGLMQFTDLPDAAQTKLLTRRQTRAALRDPLQLLPFADTDFEWTPGRDLP